MKKIIMFLTAVFMLSAFVSCENNQEQILEEDDTVEEIADDEEEGDTILVIDLVDQDTAE